MQLAYHIVMQYVSRLSTRGAVSDGQQLLLQIVPPQHPQGVKALLGLLDNRCGVFSPGEISGDDGIET